MSKIFSQKIPKKLSYLFLFTVFFLVAFGAVSFLFFKEIGPAEPVSAAPGTPCAEHNVFGWAWSENIGWVSFSCKNCDQDNNGYIDSGNCGGDNTSTFANDYGVDIDSSTGAFSSYAWSPNVGWVSFNSSDTTGCPSGTCAPTLNLNNRQVSGYARVLAYKDTDWGGWLRLRDTNYGVYIKSATSEFHNWAWAPEQIGWLSFNCENCEGTACDSYPTCGEIGHPDYFVKTTLTFGPTAENLTAPENSSKNYCDCYFEYGIFKTDGRNGAPDFSWQYTDPNTLNLKSYQIKINNVNDVNDVNTEADLTVSDLNYTSGTTIYQPIGVKISPSTNELAYNKTYYWWVKVCNQNDECSNWAAGSSFNTPVRHFPIVRVVWDRPVLTTNETVQFCATADTSQPCSSSADPCCSVCWIGAGSPIVDPDNPNWKCSICYDSANNPVACQAVGSTYVWYMPPDFVANTDYNYVSATTNTSANPRVKFLTTGKDKKFRLYVSGSGCGGEGGGGIQLPVPKWKEITPF